MWIKTQKIYKSISERKQDQQWHYQQRACVRLTVDISDWSLGQDETINILVTVTLNYDSKEKAWMPVLKGYLFLNNEKKHVGGALIIPGVSLSKL